eukprot:tig00000498_g1630.t1
MGDWTGRARRRALRAIALLVLVLACEATGGSGPNWDWNNDHTTYELNGRTFKLSDVASDVWIIDLNLYASDHEYTEISVWEDYDIYGIMKSDSLSKIEVELCNRLWYSDSYEESCPTEDVKLWRFQAIQRPLYFPLDGNTTKGARLLLTAKTPYTFDRLSSYTLEKELGWLNLTQNTATGGDQVTLYGYWKGSSVYQSPHLAGAGLEMRNFHPDGTVEVASKEILDGAVDLKLTIKHRFDPNNLMSDTAHYVEELRRVVAAYVPCPVSTVFLARFEGRNHVEPSEVLTTITWEVRHPQADKSFTGKSRGALTSGFNYTLVEGVSERVASITADRTLPRTALETRGDTTRELWPVAGAVPEPQASSLVFYFTTNRPWREFADDADGFQLQWRRAVARGCLGGEHEAHRAVFRLFRRVVVESSGVVSAEMEVLVEDGAAPTAGPSAPGSSPASVADCIAGLTGRLDEEGTVFLTQPSLSKPALSPSPTTPPAPPASTAAAPTTPPAPVPTTAPAGSSAPAPTASAASNAGVTTQAWKFSDDKKTSLAPESGSTPANGALVGELSFATMDWAKFIESAGGGALKGLEAAQGWAKTAAQQLGIAEGTFSFLSFRKGSVVATFQVLAPTASVAQRLRAPGALSGFSFDGQPYTPVTTVSRDPTGGSGGGGGGTGGGGTTTTTPAPSSDSGGLSGAAIGGIVGGAIGGVLLVGVVGFCAWRAGAFGGSDDRKALSAHRGAPGAPAIEMYPPSAQGPQGASAPPLPRLDLLRGTPQDPSAPPQRGPMPPTPPPLVGRNPSQPAIVLPGPLATPGRDGRSAFPGRRSESDGIDLPPLPELHDSDVTIRVPEDALSCPVCLEMYNRQLARTAQVLACGHTICLVCVSKMGGIDQPPRLCPLCRVPFHPDQLRQNQALMALLP